MKHVLYFIGFALLLYSCASENNIVRNAEIKLVAPEKSLSIEKDPAFDGSFPQVLSCRDIVVLNDSIMLLYDMVAPGTGGNFYKAYSLEDYSFKGECVREGRGPGEMLAPDLCGTYRSSEDGKTRCYVLDMMLGKTFGFDLSEAWKHEPVAEIFELPDNVLSAQPYRDSLQFITDIENDNILFHVVDRNAEKLKTFRLYAEDISAERYLTQFSNSVTLNNEKGMAALVMLGIPQINFLYLEDGKVHSVAVDRRYRNWRNILSSATDIPAYMETTQYYNNAVSTSAYVMAIYVDQKIKDIIERKPGPAPHIHIFDWEGNFLYDIEVKEGISRIDYDTERKYLYGLDVNKGRIYRYDFSRVL